MTHAERIAELETQLAEALRELEKARREFERVSGQNGKLVKQIEEWRRGHRERRPRRSSRAEGRSNRPKEPAKKRGRRAGATGSNRPIPAPDRVEHHPMAEVCTCGGCVHETDEEKSTIVQEIPHVKVENVRHVARVGICERCGKAVHARLPGMTAEGTTAAHVQVGPSIIALIESLRFEYNVPLRKLGEFLSTWFSVELSSGGVASLLARQAERARPVLDTIEALIRQAPVVGTDETSLREDGKGAYVWLVHTPNASYYRVERSRGAWVIDEMLGGFIGVLCTDFYAAYTRGGLAWQQAFCGAHTVREARKLSEVSPSPKTVRFSARLSAVYSLGAQAQRSHDEAVKDLFVIAMHDLAHDASLGQHSDVARLQTRIRTHFSSVVRFVERPDIPWTNNWSEREFRWITGFRKITGGTRGETGSETFATHASILRTLKKNDLPLRPWVTEFYWAHVAGRSLPTVFRPVPALC